MSELVVEHAYFEWMPVLHTLVNGITPFWEFRDKRPWNEYIMQYSLISLIVGCVMGSSGVIMYNAIVCHVILVLVLSFKRGVKAPLFSTGREKFSNERMGYYWIFLMMAFISGLGHALVLGYRIYPFIDIGEYILCMASAISVTGFMFSLIKGLYFFNRRRVKMHALFSPDATQPIEQWQNTRFHIDTEHPEDIVRLNISFLGTLVVIITILGILCTSFIPDMYPIFIFYCIIITPYMT